MDAVPVHHGRRGKLAPRHCPAQGQSGGQQAGGTLDPHLARYPDDEWAQLATAQLPGVRATLAQLSK
ncbi:hypothetical protein ACFZCU_47785 [Streptomyces canus]|uniref:hypothetical protein n=1 Tax=Streptomyces canus TaxID=58343 RepID=UPI0036F146F8